VTCAPISSLRNLPLKRLKEYLAAYNIPNVGPKEKEDFVQAVIKARNPQTGTLSPEAEVRLTLNVIRGKVDNQAYYRRHSVPKKGAPTVTNGTTPTPRTTPAQPQQARPPTNSTYNRPPPQQAYRPPPPSHQYRPPPLGSQYRPPPPTTHYRPPTQSSPRPRPPAPTPPAPVVKTPPPPVPTIMGLVALPTSYLSTLSIGTLKAMLYENHVKVDFKQVLEK